MAVDYEDGGRELEKLYDKLKRDTLEDTRDVLVKDIDSSKFHAYLRSKKVFDADDEEEINSEKTRRKRTESFLNILLSKGGYGFDMFCEALLQSAGQLHLLKQLLECFDKKRFSETTSTNYPPPIQDLPKPGECGGPDLPPGFYLNEPPPPYSE